MSDHEHYSDALLRRILRSVKTITVVGASPDRNRPSNSVMRFLQGKGYRTIPVNPRAAGDEIWGETCYAGLREIPREAIGPIDMVDVFRRPDRVAPIVDEAIAIGAKVVWMQIGVRDDAAAAKAEAAGLTVVMNRCPRIEYGRLYGADLRSAGRRS